MARGRRAAGEGENVNWTLPEAGRPKVGAMHCNAAELILEAVGNLLAGTSTSDEAEYHAEEGGI